MINVTNVSKSFKKKHKNIFKNISAKDSEYINAVKDVSFTIKEGEVVGLLGANGAGKSTMIKMMIGILKADSGDIKINNYDPFNQRAQFMKEIGVVFGQRSQLWWELTVIDSFKIIKEIYSISDDDFNENLKFFIEELKFEGLFDKPVRSLSLGQRMLCDVVAAFLHNPKVVFLDEPTIGLDVSIKNKIRLLIKTLNERKNTTIIITTHDMDDVKVLCENIILINKGELFFHGSIEKISKVIGESRLLKVTFNNNEEAKALYETTKLSEYTKFFKEIHLCDDYIEFEINNVGNKMGNILSYILGLYDIENIEISEIDIEKIMKKIYEENCKWENI